MTDAILVTGATGRVGGALVRALAGRAPVRAATRDPVGAAWPDGTQPVRFDFADPATHGPALAGAGAAFLMRPPAVTDPAAFEPFLDAAARAGVRRVAVLSVRGADRVRVLPHHGMERRVMAGPFDWTVLRPADFMQNLETVLADEIRDHGEIALPAGRGRSPLVDVEDVAEVAARVLTRDGHVGRGYDLTGPAALDFAEVASVLSDVLDRPVRYRRLSVAGFLLHRRRAGTPLRMAAVMTALYTVQRLGLAGGVAPDVERLLGRPATPLAAYVARSRHVWTR